jgi:quaternary ammonium compound-resistance protein SugE
MAWFLLSVAGALEVTWTIGMKYSQGFTRPLPTAVTVCAMVGSMWLLAIATRTLPLGTAYAVWVGIGATGAAIAGLVLFKEPFTLLRLLFIVLLIGSIIGLKLTAR